MVPTGGSVTPVGDAFVVYNPGEATPEEKGTTVAAAFGFAQGTHFNAAFAEINPDGVSDDEWMHFGIGHNRGDTSIAATYTASSVGGGGQSWAVGIGHAIGSAQVYAGYKQLSFDDAAKEDYGIFVVGSRVLFN